jgi:hypothetical protein
MNENTSTKQIYDDSSYNLSKLEPHELQVSFPQKLFMLLEKESPEIIGWIPNGKGFRINNIDEFQSSIIPKYFKHTKFTSFQRQLNLYGFRRVTKGEDQGAYFHPKFIYGRSDSVYEIRRLPGKTDYQTQLSDATFLNYSNTIYNLKPKDIQNGSDSSNSKTSKLSQKLGFANNGANECLPPAKRKNLNNDDLDIKQNIQPIYIEPFLPSWEESNDKLYSSFSEEFNLCDFDFSDNIDFSIDELIQISS